MMLKYEAFQCPRMFQIYKKVTVKWELIEVIDSKINPNKYFANIHIYTLHTYMYTQSLFKQKCH